MFPEELPRRLIKMFSFVGETVLDPFLGSGTVIKAAKNLCRNSIGYEINKDYLPFIKQKIGIDGKKLFDGEHNFEIVFQETKNIQKGRNLNEGLVKKSAINDRINDPNYWKILLEEKKLKAVNAKFR